MIVAKAESERVTLRPFLRSPTVAAEQLAQLYSCLHESDAYLKLGGGEYAPLTLERRQDIETLEAKIRRTRCAMKWTITPYPSSFLADTIGLSLAELQDLYFASCFVDYREQEASQRQLAGQISAGLIHIVADDTNLTMRIVGEPHLCNGRNNLPDGEIFWAVEPYSTDGWLTIPTPTTYGSLVFSHLRLRFFRGAVVEFDSSDNSEFTRLLATDAAAPYLGEFAFGTNRRARMIGHSFYDEKVFGTFHVALGAIAPQMESALHLDLVKRVAGCVISSNGNTITLA